MSQISADVKLTKQGVSKTINSFLETGSILPKVQGGKNRSVLTDNVLRHVELYKTKNLVFTAGRLEKSL